MRCALLVIALGIHAIVECLPNIAKSNNVLDEHYLDVVKEIADVVEESKRENDPPYIDSYYDILMSGQDESKRVQADQQDANVPPYTQAEKTYIEVARKVADAYMNERKVADSNVEHLDSAVAALRSFNRPSARIRQLIEEQEREESEMEALLLLAAEEDTNLLREIDVNLTPRSARDDPSCKITINCKTSDNKTFVDGIEFRNIDGICNNENNYTWGMTYVQHRRLLPDTYHNGKWHLRQLSITSSTKPRNDVRLPSARNISNVVHSSSSLPKPDNDDNVSLALFYFLQFIDHDLALTPEGHIASNRNCCKEDVDKPRGFCLPIKAEVSESHFPTNYCMSSRRSFTLFRCNDKSKFQNQINQITSFLDASMVYGSTVDIGKELRTGIGGWLKESSNEFLPNTTLENDLRCNSSDPNFNFCYEAGDIRVNVHPGLTSYHTIFVRQHNRIAKQFAEIRPEWTDERLYQETRKIIGALIQHIVYSEVLPVIFRQEELDLYGVSNRYRYSSSIDASMTQAFSMAFRYHQLMPHRLHLAKQVSSAGSPVQNFQEHNQENAFLRPYFVNNHNYNGLDEIMLGLLASKCPHVDRIMNDATRNLLFLDKKGNSFDLVALNIMRGREWGMPTYTSYRAFCGLGNATKWEDLLNTTLREDVDKMASVYADVRDVDLWTGLVTEKKLPGSISGPTQTCLLAKHFAKLKHGDRFWYENTDFGFIGDRLQQIKTKTLARVLCDNLGVTKMRPEVFRSNSEWVDCSEIRATTGGDWDLSSWTP